MPSTTTSQVGTTVGTFIQGTNRVANGVYVAEGKLVLGTWQQVFHLECDVRGRQCTVVVTIVGD